jgi:hypothetical protein
VATGWLFGVGVFVRAIELPVWIMAMVGLEATVAVALTALVLTRSLAMATWLSGLAACIAGWMTYIAVASPWTWTGEVTLLLPAAILTFLWPLVWMDESQRRNPHGTGRRHPSLRSGAG